MMMNSRTSILAILAASALAPAYDGTAGFKKKADGTLEVDANGNPIWVDAQGKESDSTATINRLNGEAAGHRQRAEDAEKKVRELGATVEAFKDIDPVKAREALTTVSKIDAKTLIDAGKVDEVRNEVTKALQPKIDEAVKERDTLATELNGLRLTTAFQGSKFVTEKLTIPADLAISAFGKNFVYEGGRFLAKKPDGSTVYSGKNPGQAADFDEALETLVNEYPHKASILKGANGQGSGNDGNGGNGGGGKKRLTMAEFSKLDASGQATHAADVRAGKAELVD